MKKLILLMVFVLVLAGCGKEIDSPAEVNSVDKKQTVAVQAKSKSAETPEQSVKNALNAIKKLDMETAQKYISTEVLNIDSTKNLSNANTELVVKNISFKIIDAVSDGSTATVKTEITNIDLKSIFGEYVKQSLAAAFANAFSEEDNKISDEELQKQAEKVFVDLLKRKDNGTVTSTAEIKLTKHEDIWKIESDDSLQDALLGGMVSAIKSLENSGWERRN